MKRDKNGRTEEKDRRVEATGPSISQLISATTFNLKDAALACSRVKKTGAPLP